MPKSLQEPHGCFHCHPDFRLSTRPFCIPQVFEFLDNNGNKTQREKDVNIKLSPAKLHTHSTPFKTKIASPPSKEAGTQKHIQPSCTVCFKIAITRPMKTIG